MTNGFVSGISIFNCSDNVRESSAATAMKQEAEKYLREHQKH